MALRRPHYARPVLGFETGPVLVSSKRCGGRGLQELFVFSVEVRSYTWKSKYVAVWICTARICFLQQRNKFAVARLNFGNQRWKFNFPIPGACPTPLRIFRQLFSASHLLVQSPARLRLIGFFVVSVGPFGPPLTFEPCLNFLSPFFRSPFKIFLEPPSSFRAASFKLLLFSF